MKERAIETLHVASDDGFAAGNIAMDAHLLQHQTLKKKEKRIWASTKLQYNLKHC